VLRAACDKEKTNERPPGVDDSDKENGMNTDQIEIVLLLDRSYEAEIDGAPIRVEGKSDSFAIAAHEKCILIGVISQQSQNKSDSRGASNQNIQRGTHSRPCSFFNVTEWFGPDLSKIRMIDAKVASFESENQFVIPRIGGCGLIVEVKLDLPNGGVYVDDLNGKYNEKLLRLIAFEAVVGAS
jgi:hypothetical protein